MPGLCALARAFKSVKAKYQLVICVPSDNKILYDEITGNKVFKNSTICKKNFIEIHQDCQTFDHWKDTFFKLQAASFIEYDKVIVVDCDMMICKNIDHLFNCPSGSAVEDIESLNTLYASSSKFNSGLFILKPDIKLFKKLCSNIAPVINQRNSQGLMVGDQDVFNYTLDNWKFSYELHLDKKYNIFWTCFPQYEKDKYILSKDAYVIHFIGNRKPWSYSKKQIRKQLTDLLFDGKHFRLMFFLLKYLHFCK